MSKAALYRLIQLSMPGQKVTYLHVREVEGNNRHTRKRRRHQGRPQEHPVGRPDAVPGVQQVEEGVPEEPHGSGHGHGMEDGLQSKDRIRPVLDMEDLTRREECKEFLLGCSGA
jgi:hypothetical protein